MAEKIFHAILRKGAFPPKSLLYAELAMLILGLVFVFGSGATWAIGVVLLVLSVTGLTFFALSWPLSGLVEDFQIIVDETRIRRKLVLSNKTLENAVAAFWDMGNDANLHRSSAIPLDAVSRVELEPQPGSTTVVSVFYRRLAHIRDRRVPFEMDNEEALRFSELMSARIKRKSDIK